LESYSAEGFHGLLLKQMVDSKKRNLIRLRTPDTSDLSYSLIEESLSSESLIEESDLSFSNSMGLIDLDSFEHELSDETILGPLDRNKKSESALQKYESESITNLLQDSNKQRVFNKRNFSIREKLQECSTPGGTIRITRTQEVEIRPPGRENKMEYVNEITPRTHAQFQYMVQFWKKQPSQQREILCYE
jgi:hypothetical protein